jgi:hypothetical protein
VTLNKNINVQYPGFEKGIYKLDEDEEEDFVTVP